jgi:signal transduction histidine kinase
MRIAYKLNIALSTTGFILFGAYAFYLEVNEEHGLRKVAEREVPMLGRAILANVENAVRENEIEDVRETIEGMERAAAPVEIIVYGKDGQVLAESPLNRANTLFEKRLSAKAARANDSVLEFDFTSSPWRSAVAFPLHEENDVTQLGTLVVARSLSDIQADLRDTKVAITVDVLLFVIVSSFLGWAMGRTYIGDPLNNLVNAMRQVRVGDLHSFVVAKRQDEIGEVASEFNIMVSELSKARETLEKEHTDRLHLELALRQADKLVTIGQLAATLAHEIGSPLQVITGRARALLERDYDRERIQRHAEVIAVQGERIAAIVEQLLGYARRRPPETVQTDLGKLVQSVVELFALEARQAQVAVGVSVEPDLPSVVCDQSSIQQLTFNLLHNALASTSTGGRIEVLIGSGSYALAEGGASLPSVFMEVSDNGCGIPEKNLPRIFDPFFTTRADAKGTGLGLAVVKNVVDEHRGKIKVTSAVGKGSKFRVDLPIRDGLPNNAHWIT